MTRLLILAFILVLSACKTGDVSDTGVDVTEDSRLYRNLMDHLRGKPGVQFQKTYVTIRGAKSFNSNIEPLYVIDGLIVGDSYQQANSMVDPNDIKSISILRDIPSTNKYGMRGANGVIEIRTKTGRKKKTMN